MDRFLTKNYEVFKHVNGLTLLAARAKKKKDCYVTFSLMNVTLNDRKAVRSVKCPLRSFGVEWPLKLVVDGCADFSESVKRVLSPRGGVFVVLGEEADEFQIANFQYPISN